MTQDLLLQELNEDGILRLSLHQGAKRNALSEAMLQALADALDQISTNASVRVVILAAEGPAFCAGHDLKELTAARENADRGRTVFERIMQLCSQVMQKIVHCPKPIIAEVDGIATAAGCQLVASCDLAIASDHAQFSTPGVHIGLFCSTPMVALSRNVAHKHAMEMLLSGDMVSAKRAYEIGLVNKVVERAKLQDETLNLARKIASKSSHTVAIGKRAFYEQAELSLAEAYQYAAHVMVENMMARDAQEGISAFIEKRPAKWQDQ
jgi:enoyl-CoA hydratase/carnithine racemase